MKYISCFTKSKADELKNHGFTFLMAKNDVWYFKNNNSNFSKEDFVLKDTKQLKFLPF